MRLDAAPAQAGAVGAEGVGARSASGRTGRPCTAPRPSARTTRPRERSGSRRGRPGTGTTRPGTRRGQRCAATLVALAGSIASRQPAHMITLWPHHRHTRSHRITFAAPSGTRGHNAIAHTVCAHRASSSSSSISGSSPPLPRWAMAANGAITWLHAWSRSPSNPHAAATCSQRASIPSSPAPATT